MTPDPLLDRILWTQLARVVPGTPPDWNADSPAARAIRGVLGATELDPEESALVARWDESRESSRKLFDRLLQARVNRALREGVRVEARRRGLEDVPAIPRVLIVREGGFGEAGASVEARPSPKQTVVEFLSGGSLDVAGLEPGAKLDQLIDLLVLANQDGAEALKESLGASASVLSAEEVPQFDLLLAAQTPSIQVFDIERELARLEDVLRKAIPAEKRPAKSGSSWSFGHDLTGERLGGKYLIRGLKGKGAFKTVYEGEDEMLGARVAVAVLNPKGARSPRALEHFQDEARKLTTLDHENIVRWITFDRSSDGLHYFVMEYLDGEELEKVLRRETRMAPKRVAGILLQVLGALRRAHAKGKHGSLLHLDLKPENVFVLPSLVPGEPERVKVIDFGIGQHVGAEVRAADHPELRTIYDLPADELDKSIGSLALPEDEDEPEEELAQVQGAQGLGKPRRRVQRARGGTLLYASPEQCKHLAGHKDIEALDGRSDLYSLGVMAFRMLTGQFPFARITTAYEAIQNHLEVPPRKVGSLGIKLPRDLAAFVDRCLVKERDKRWKDAGEAYEALARIVHPKLSPLKISVPFALVGALGLGALYYGRDPVVNPVALIDPSVENVAERVQGELFLGPASPRRTLRLESEVAWGTGARPEPHLVDAASGSPLAGWSVGWAGGDGNAVEIACLEGAKSARAVIELDGGRRSLWRSKDIALHHLGSWTIERAGVAGYLSSKRLDPRQHALELELGGDREGREALASIEAWLGDTRIGRTSFGGTASGVASAERVRYAGPALDALFTDAPRTVRLRLVARDRAGQELETSLSLELAGERADFVEAETGFVARAEGDSALLPAASETLLLPENALRLTTRAPARARLFLEPATTPAFELDLDPSRSGLVPLQRFGLGGASELAGTLRIELDDAAWVERVAPAPRVLRLPFYYTPAAPGLEVRLLGLEGPLLEASATRAGAAGADGAEVAGSAATNHVNLAPATGLLVRVPPGSAGSNLWIEARASGPGLTQGELRRLTQAVGGFEGPLELAEEGLYELSVRQYVLVRGDERGPLIPPEHVFRVRVDRTPPAIALTLEGANATAEGGEPLFRAEPTQNASAVFGQRIRATLDEPELAALRWSLLGPGGEVHEGALAPASELELPALGEHQSAEGRYELELVATDRAGNVSRESLVWEVARLGPTLTLLEPLAGAERRWALGTGRGWNVRVSASDPNGVRSVRAALVYRGERVRELALQPTVGGLWELPADQRPDAHEWWSGEELVLELEACDGAGLTRTLSERALVPELPRSGERVIVRRERPEERLVEILAGVEYVFGGRPGEGRRPWNVPIPRDALRPFYLEAREVTAAEFRAFVADPRGYGDPRWWPEGAQPEAERAEALLQELASGPERPATGIAWVEATAYAAWRGMRLPTLLEWEFAVRGSEYRTAPAEASAPATPGWPANLCGGPREWTATPERLSDDALDFVSACRRYPERLLAPPGEAEGAAAPASAASERPRARSHWVAGPSPGEPPSWSARALGPDAPGDASIGFRCALDRERAHSLLDRGDYVIVE